jgi:hypothetical protein
MPKFKVAYSTDLGLEKAMTLDAADAKEAEELARKRIRIARVHSITPLR